MAQKISRKELKHDEFVDAAFDLGDWIQKNWRNLAYGAGAVVAVALVVGGYFAWSASGARKAKGALAEGMRLYGATEQGAPAGGVAPAPDYAGALAAFERAGKAGGKSSVGRIAEMFRGAALLRLGRPAEAVPVLEAVTRSADREVANSARALLAQAYEASGNGDGAEAVLRELSQEKSGYPGDVALLDLARLQRKQGKAEESTRTLQDLMTRYPQSARASEARSMLEGTAAGQ
jgi:TolA-binding protein